MVVIYYGLKTETFAIKNGRQAGLGAQCIVVDNDSLTELHGYN